MTKCITCQHIDLRAYPNHARVGFGRCSHQKLQGVFESIVKERDCDKFKAADPETVAKRESWWEKQK